MTFKLIKEIPFPAQDYFRTPSSRHIDHLTLLYDYLTETFWPSIGYTITDIGTPPQIYGNTLYGKGVSFPVTNAEGYADHIMHTWCGFSFDNNERFWMLQGTNQYLDSSYASTIPLGECRISVAGNFRAYEESTQYLPIKVYQDQARKSDWFVLCNGRLAMWQIKPRVMIHDLYREDLRNPNIRYTTSLGFQYRDTSYTVFGCHGCDNTTGSRRAIAYVVPLDGFETRNAAFFNDTIATLSQTSALGAQRNVVASFHNPNYALWRNNDDTYADSGSGVPNFLYLTLDIRNMDGTDSLGIRSPYYRLQDNEGNWWLLGWMQNLKKTWTPAFNCGPELP